MRIAHVTATFLPYHSGTGVVCYENALGLAHQGHEVHVFTSNHPPGEYAYPPEITVHRLPIVMRVGNAPLLPDLMKLRDFDLIHLHYPFIFGQEMIYLLSWLRGVRYVITYHQDLILSGLFGVAANIHALTFEPLILQRATRLMVTSRDYARYSRIAPITRRMEDRVVEMPNGVDPNRFHPDLNPGDLRAEYGLKPEDRLILFVGGLDTPHYFKGVDVLIEAVSQIAAEDVKLVVVGDGDLRPRYTERAAELGIANRVIFCGRISNEALPLHYAMADVLVLPSTTTGEAFGIVLLEAMACGKPVIASNLPGVRTVVNHEEDGFLTSPGNVEELAQHLTTLLDNPELRQTMGARGRAKVEMKYAWSAVTRRLAEEYEEVLAHA